MLQTGRPSALGTLPATCDGTMSTGMDVVESPKGRPAATRALPRGVLERCSCRSQGKGAVGGQRQPGGWPGVLCARGARKVLQAPGQGQRGRPPRRLVGRGSCARVWGWWVGGLCCPGLRLCGPGLELYWPFVGLCWSI